MSQTPAPSVVEAYDLERHYPGRPRPAVSRLSFTLEPGEVLGLVGPSGCGKSTTLRMIAGLEPLDGGTVRIGGVDTSRTPPERRRVGWVPQSYGLFPHMSVAANIGYGLAGRRKADRARAVRDAMELTHVTELADYNPAQLSGGQRQRIALARAIASDPKVLLLDEPLAALDPQLRDALRLELGSILRESGRAAIVVTHDQSEALALADKIAVLRDGELLQLASPEELWRNPADAFVANFVARATILHGRVEADGGVGLGNGNRIPVEDLDPIGSPPAPGDQVDVIVRPRDVIPLADDADGADGLLVRVRQCEYLGDGVRVLGDVDGTTATLELPPGHAFAETIRVRGRRGSLSVRTSPSGGAGPRSDTSLTSHAEGSVR